MNVIRRDAALVIRVRPGVLDGVLALAVPLPAWVFLFEGRLEGERVGMLFGMSVILALILSFFVEWSDFTFDSVTGRLRWRRRLLWRSIAGTDLPLEGEVALREVRGIEVQAYSTDSDNITLSRIRLDLPGGTLPLTRTYHTGWASRTVSRDIVSWMAERGHRPARRGF